MNDDGSNIQSELAYDLRQTYAKILTDDLIKVADARERNDFNNWFEFMVWNLHTEINQKLDKTEREEYEKLLTDTTKILNQYPDAYLGNDTTPKNVYAIKNALKKLETWLKDKMEAHGMYGSKWEDEGF